MFRPFGPYSVTSLRPTRAQSESLTRSISDIVSNGIDAGHATLFTSRIRWVSCFCSQVCPNCTLNGQTSSGQSEEGICLYFSLWLLTDAFAAAGHAETPLSRLTEMKRLSFSFISYRQCGTSGTIRVSCHHRPRARRNKLPPQLLTWKPSTTTVNSVATCIAGVFDPPPFPRAQLPLQWVCPSLKQSKQSRLGILRTIIYDTTYMSASRDIC